MVNFTSKEIDEFYEQLMKIYSKKSPDKELRFIEFLISEESKVCMKLFYRLNFDKMDESLSI
jgi:hypothetical protein